MISPSSIRIKAMLAIGIAALLIEGCSVGPKYKGPSPSANALAPFHNKVNEPEPGTPPAPALDEWWSGFNDPMLVTVIQRALNQNLDLAASLERVNQARAVAGGAAARLLPEGEFDA